MNLHPHRIATVLFAAALTLSVGGGVALADSAHTGKAMRAEARQVRLVDISRADAAQGFALHRVTPVESSLARQSLFRSPLKWSPDTSSTQWSPTSVFNPASPNGVIQGVSCLSATSCEGVGSYQNAQDQPVLLAEVFSGGKWTAQSVPKPVGSVSSELLDVSCTAVDACVAVGDYGTADGNLVPLAELWNGVGWTVRLPNPADNQGGTLAAVSCTGTTCEAVGYYFNNAGDQLDLAELWNGSSWKIQTTPDPTATNSDQLNGVSCTTLGCEAVGSYGTGSEGLDSASFAVVWNGVEWSSQTIPEPSDSNDQGTTLESVSCVSTIACEAVGSYTNKTDFEVALAEVWNGVDWAVQPTVNPAASTELSLQVVSCVAKNACAAVGIENYGRASDTAGVAEVWNGLDWALQSTADPDGSANTSLGTVSCPVAGFCEAGGEYVNSAGDSTALMEGTTHGGWAVQAAPGGSGNFGAQLAGVSCSSKSACEAVGEYNANNSNGEDNPWAEQWSGGRWKLQVAPEPRGYSNSELKAVSCRSASRCEAVGDYLDSAGDNLTLAELWNGHRWTVQKTANPSGSLTSVLAGVSCTSSTDCEAIGTEAGVDPSVLVEHWNGHKWDLQKTPKTAGIGGDLRAVSCVSAKNCEAVGQYLHNENSSFLLAEAWSGHKWALQRVPAPKGSHNALLNGISCTSSDDCEAVGTYVHGQEERPLAEAWNGHKWAIQSTVNPDSSGDVSLLDAVSCTAKNACEAVGYHLSLDSFGQYTLVEVWNGHTWRRQSSATPGSGGTASSLGVSCVSKNLCRMVGYYDVNVAAADMQLLATVPLIETFRP